MSKFPENEFKFKKESVDKIHEISLDYFKTKGFQDEYRDQQYSFELLSDLITSDVYMMLNGFGFSVIEASMELSNSLHLTLEGYYRYAYLALRNCLELIILSIYFTKSQPSTDIKDYDSVEEWWNASRINEKFTNWLNSKDSTPYFSKMLDSLSKEGYFQSFNEKFNLVKSIKDVYYELSDYIHIKGKNKSTKYFEGSFYFSYSRSNAFSEEKFNQYWESRKRVVKYSVLMILLHCPLGLKGFDIETKFGINHPIGFLSEGQSDLLRSVMHTEELLFIDAQIIDDSWIIAVNEFINSQPDITDEEIEKQIKEFREEFSSSL